MLSMVYLQQLLKILKAYLDHFTDIMHSALGLTALAVMHEPDLKSMDPTLCISISARDEFEQQMALKFQK